MWMVLSHCHSKYRQFQEQLQAHLPFLGLYIYTNSLPSSRTLTPPPPPPHPPHSPFFILHKPVCLLWLLVTTKSVCLSRLFLLSSTSFSPPLPYTLPPPVPCIFFFFTALRPVPFLAPTCWDDRDLSGCFSTHTSLRDHSAWEASTEVRKRPGTRLTAALATVRHCLGNRLIAQCAPA